ncbi:MAG: PD-(D/E)XK nuclease family protein, partial [Lentisphaeria bacterium]|nr:PD-(D/E)XK nuclease family protein [Lentisphaeria bacterium]
NGALSGDIMVKQKKEWKDNLLANTLLQSEAFITNLLYQLLKEGKLSTKVFYDGEVDEIFTESQHNGGDKLDIEFKNKGETVCIIENKLTAEFGEKQLDRYYNLLKKSKGSPKKLITLTKFDVSKDEQVTKINENPAPDIAFENLYWHDIVKEIKDADAYEVMTSRYFRLQDNMLDMNKRDFYIDKITAFLEKLSSDKSLKMLKPNKTSGWCNITLAHDHSVSEISGSYSKIAGVMGAINVCLDGFAIRRTRKTPVLPLAERHDMMPYFSLSLMAFYYLKRRLEKDILIAEKIADADGKLQIPLPSGWHFDEQTKTPASNEISERFVKISFPVSSQSELDKMIENENSPLYNFLENEINNYLEAVKKRQS